METAARNAEETEEAKGLGWLLQKMAKRRGFQTVEDWQKAEEAEAT